MLAAPAAGLGGCSLSMHLASLQIDPETTASVTRAASPLDPSLDEEDWRRAQAALSLAVDPQGSGQPVNWDNPATKRRGSFVPAGNMILVENTVCRPFTAVVVQAGGHQPGAARETRHSGQACRLGPGEWAMRQINPQPLALTEATAKLPPGGRSAPAEHQPLPAPTTGLLEALEPQR